MNTKQKMAVVSRLKNETGHTVVECWKALIRLGTEESALEYLRTIPVKIKESDCKKHAYLIVDNELHCISSNTIEGLKNQLVYDLVRSMKSIEEISNIVESIRNRTHEDVKVVYIGKIDPSFHLYHHQIFVRGEHALLCAKILITDVQIELNDLVDIAAVLLRQEKNLETVEAKERLQLEGVKSKIYSSLNMIYTYV